MWEIVEWLWILCRYTMDVTGWSDAMRIATEMSGGMFHIS
jgi:hypothetical protein